MTIHRNQPLHSKHTPKRNTRARMTIQKGKVSVRPNTASKTGNWGADQPKNPSTRSHTNHLIVNDRQYSQNSHPIKSAFVEPVGSNRQNDPNDHHKDHLPKKFMQLPRFHFLNLKVAVNLIWEQIGEFLEGRQGRILWVRRCLGRGLGGGWPDLISDDPFSF